MVEQQDFYTPERILVIAAHADDIEFGVAGSVARWTKAESQVTYCIITDNSSGSNDPETDLDKLVETRRKEQIAAAKVVGVEDVRNLSYRDGTLQPTLELRRQLTRLIREIRPDLVITLDPTTVFASDHGYINHPDHRAAGEAAIYATFPSAGARPIFRELLDEGYEPHDVSKVYMTLTNHPMLYIDVTETYEQKQAALRCHASQLNEDVIGMIAKWDSEAGKKIGCRFAESFRVIDLTRDNQA